jgi:predicted NUDIX family NTP pyrophosphohydrolase
MPSQSAGLLMCRVYPELQFFLVHPGGPYYTHKEEGVWSIPKGLIENSEDPLVTAQREFTEETGISSKGPYASLGTVKMKSGKIIHAWSFIGTWIPSDGIVSNTFPMEWPPRSGKMIHVPEADRAAWCTYEQALLFIHSSQKIFIEKARNIYEAISD